MNSKDVLINSMNTADMVCMAYLADLSDEELMKRPHGKCNHLNWQIGHLIASENSMIEGVAPGSMPALPDGFADKYTKETTTVDDASAFCSKEELMAAYKVQRDGTIAALNALADEDLDKPSPESMQGYAPKVGDAFNMQGSHWLMHCGQWVIVRRELGRDIVI